LKSFLLIQTQLYPSASQLILLENVHIINTCIIKPHRHTMYIDAAYCYRLLM